MSGIPTEDYKIRAEGQLLQAIVAHWIHEDSLYWQKSRQLFAIQFALIAVVSASLAAILKDKGNWVLLIIPGVLAFLAGYFSHSLSAVADIIRRNRDVNRSTIAHLSRHLVGTALRSQLNNVLGSENIDKFGLMRFSLHDLDDVADAGRSFQRRMFNVCIALDLLAGILLTIAGFYLALTSATILRS